MNKQQGYELFRTLTKETNRVIVPDTRIAVFMTGGLEWTNDLLHYHRTTDATGITLAAGTQDYDLPAACVELLWVEWNGRHLAETDEDTLRNDNENWRQRPAGTPEKYFLLAGRTLTFLPKPNADAVAKAPNPVLHYVSAPADFALSGFAQLAAMHHRLPVLAACAEWCTAINENPTQAAGFMGLFEKRAEVAAAVYERRMLRKD